MRKAARESGAGSHSAREMAAAHATAAKPSVATEATNVTATKTGVPTEATPVTAAKTTVPPASTLRPHGDSQEERERRDGHQATHTCIL